VRYGSPQFAFDSVIVGALALPWLALVIELLFTSRTGQVAHLMSLIKDGEYKIPPAAAGVLLFAMAYFLGAAVSRVSGDLFNDGEVSMEDRIRAAVYSELVPLGPNNLPKKDKEDDQDKEDDEDKEDPPFWVNLFHLKKGALLLEDRLKVHRLPQEDESTDSARKRRLVVKAVFHLQESALLQEGEDKTERLRQLFEQRMVLRGAAFNGLIAVALCFFGWCAAKPERKKFFFFWIGWIVSSGLVLLGFYFLIQTFRKVDARGEPLGFTLRDPPFTEFTVIIFGLAGFRALYKGAPERAYGVGLVLSLLLTK
jgi:hypothetical protein